MGRAQILEVLYAAVDDINESRPASERLEGSDDLVLFSEGGGLDSLGCINLILAAEERLNQQHGTQLNLSVVLMSDDSVDPPETLGSLADMIEGLLAES